MFESCRARFYYFGGTSSPPNLPYELIRTIRRLNSRQIVLHSLGSLANARSLT